MDDRYVMLPQNELRCGGLTGIPAESDQPSTWQSPYHEQKMTQRNGYYADPAVSPSKNYIASVTTTPSSPLMTFDSSSYWYPPSSPSQHTPNSQPQSLPVTPVQYHRSPFLQSPIVATTRSHSIKRNKARQSSYTRWTLEEDDMLRNAVSIHGPHKWSLIASHVPNRTPMQCSTRWLGALNPNIHKGRWTEYEDSILRYSVLEYANVTDSQGRAQPIPWNRIAERIPNRTGIQCQARWTEALDPYVRKGKWGTEEDELLRSGVDEHGRCWIRIAESIPGRTQRQCRTRWMQLQCKQTKQQQHQKPGKKQDLPDHDPSMDLHEPLHPTDHIPYVQSPTEALPSLHMPSYQPHTTAYPISQPQPPSYSADLLPYASPTSSMDDAVSPSSTEDDRTLASGISVNTTPSNSTSSHPYLDPMQKPHGYLKVEAADYNLMPPHPPSAPSSMPNTPLNPALHAPAKPFMYSNPNLGSNVIMPTNSNTSEYYSYFQKMAQANHHVFTRPQ
ncbi:hypothetical protein DM01DRAFT_1331728 [Hesseltinella vesiculosa]|uniref:Homeodomain-like protein n=1 Tax=Hesseltinella vesiculosa TaxID=101127 RepID=A0A1X2GW56_9FUNG|nr:hypothetical protein DM01DRAFT_1331728 [Hesseltinella vesiculosa]